MSADLVVYNQSKESTGLESVMSDKKWLQVLDQNNGSYTSGQSTLETTSLSTSNRYMNYREAYLAVPVLITVGNNTNVNTSGLSSAANKGNLVGLKNSYTSLIHSMSVDLNGTNIIQSTPFSEFYNAFNLMTCLSFEDVKTQGASIGFYPDDALSATSFTANNAGGIAGATVNNKNFNISPGSAYTANPAAATGNPANALIPVSDVPSKIQGNHYNKGFAERLKYINYDQTQPVQGSADEALQSAFLTDTTALYKNAIFNLVAGAAAQSPLIQVQVMAIIKLRHLHSFFNNICLSQGLQFRFIINFNNSTSTLTAAGDVLTTETLIKSQFGGVNPLMISSALPGQGGVAQAVAGEGGDAAANGTIRADLSVGNKCLDPTLKSFGAADSQLPQSVSLYVPSYTMNPGAEDLYQKLGPRKINYSDIYNFKITNVGANASFNQLITSGIRGVRSVVVMPMFPAASNGTQVSEFHSTQSDCGGGPTALLAQITNFQVQVGGVNQIQTNGRYEFEIFNNYVYGSNAVNGGLTDGLNSGLVGQHDWSRKYLYYYIDCNRGSDLERDTPKSIQIQGQNKSMKVVDYYVFVEYENNITIDTQSGAIQP